MIGGLARSIYSWWSASSLPATFTGGLWHQEAKHGAPFPYVVFDIIGSTSSSWTSDSEIRRQAVQFSIYWKENGTSDPAIAVGELQDSLDAAIKSATFNITGGGEVFSLRRTRDDIRKDPHTSQVWKGELDYRILRRENE